MTRNPGRMLLLEIELDQIWSLSLGSIRGDWETVSGSFLIPLEVVWRFQVSMRPIFPSPSKVLFKSDDCDRIIFSNWHCLSWSDGLRVISNESMAFNDPKKFDDLRYSMILVIQRTLIIQSLWWCSHLRWSSLTSNHCITGFGNHYLISLLVDVFSSPSTLIRIWNVSSSNIAFCWSKKKHMYWILYAGTGDTNIWLLTFKLTSHCSVGVRLLTVPFSHQPLRIPHRR